MANQTLRQLGKLSLCVLASAPLTYDFFLALQMPLGEWFSDLWFSDALIIAICSLFWSLVAAAGIQALEQPPLKGFLLNWIGLAFLTACVNFILLFGAAVIWVMFFFVS